MKVKSKRPKLFCSVVILPLIANEEFELERKCILSFCRNFPIDSLQKTNVRLKFQENSKDGENSRVCSQVSKPLLTERLFPHCVYSLGVRTISGANTFVVYEIWANSEDLNRYLSVFFF